MIPMPPPPPVRHFTVSQVWPCSSCGYLARRDISSAACPNCGNIGLDGSNVRSDSSPGRLQSGSQGISSDSALSEAPDQDVQTVAAGFPEPSTLFIQSTEASGDVFMSIRSFLGTNASVNFGEFPDDLLGTTTAGYLIRADRPLTVQEMAGLADFLNSPRTDKFVADDDLSTTPLRSLDPGEYLVGGVSLSKTDDASKAGMLANVSATPSFKAEQHEDWEIVDPSNNDNKDLRATSDEMPAPDIKSYDTKVTESLDTRYSLIAKPQRFFKVGRVFITLWSEPASSNARDGPNLSSSTIGGRVFSETRRFVVVRSGHGYALCCPIQTYQKRGTTKSHINLESHALVYVAGSEPKLLPLEESPRMGKFPIVVEDKSVTIDQSSRLNFGKVYTVEHNIKVRNVGKISKESLPRLKASLVKSMRVNVSDGEAETGTETEDNVSRPTPVVTEPGVQSGEKRTISSSGRKSYSAPSTARKSTFFISSEGIDREVITTDICRYLGNDALVKPGVHQDPNTGRSQEGFYIVAYRPPTSEQLADLKADSQKWREERERNSARSQGGYYESATRQATTGSSFSYDPPISRGYPPTTSAQTSLSYYPSGFAAISTPPGGGYSESATLQATTGSSSSYDPPIPSGYPPTTSAQTPLSYYPSGYAAMSTPPGSGSYYTSALSNFIYGSPGNLNLSKPLASDPMTESKAPDENMPDKGYDY